jgi:streptogramin lyase
VEGCPLRGSLASVSRAAWTIGTLVGLALALAFVLLLRGSPRVAQAPGADASIPASPRSASAPAASAYQPLGLDEFQRIALPGAVYDMAFDSQRDAIWFAYMLSGEVDYLYRFDVATADLSRIELPPTDHNGFLGRVVISPDYSVWLTEEYRVVRFDPTTGGIQSLKLPVADADAFNSGSPGTWPTAITFDSEGRALVARHNLASLLRLDSALRQVGRVPLPKGYGSLSDVLEADGLIYAAADDGRQGVAVLHEDGSVAEQTSFAAYHLFSGTSGVLGLGQSGAALLAPEAPPP